MTREHSMSLPAQRPKRERNGRWLSRADRVLLALLVLLAAAGPFLGGYYLYVFTLAGIYAVICLGNNLLLSHGGLVSIGQGALCAIGAYAYGAAAQQGWPVPQCLLVSVLASTLSGAIVGLPALRLSGHYLALVTLAFTISVPEVIIVLDNVTGGASGMAITTAIPPTANFYMMLAAVALIAVSQSQLIASPFGIGLRLLRDSSRAAASVGIRGAKYKLIAFAYSGALAGFAGASFASATGYLTPGMFDVWLSIYVLAAVVLGGMRHPAGAVLGASIVAIVPQLVSQFQGLPSILFGSFLLLAILLRSLRGRRASGRLPGRRGHV